MKMITIRMIIMKVIVIRMITTIISTLGWKIISVN